VPLVIRDAQQEDVEGLAPLLAALGYPVDGTTLAVRLSSLVASDPTARILVAVDGMAILGFVTLHGTPTLHRPAMVGRITALSVTPEARGRGVGRRLVEAAEAHFEAAGAVRLEVTSGPTHEPAFAFYRRLGYDDQGLRFAKPLPREIA